MCVLQKACGLCSIIFHLHLLAAHHSCVAKGDLHEWPLPLGGPKGNFDPEPKVRGVHDKHGRCGTVGASWPHAPGISKLDRNQNPRQPFCQNVGGRLVTDIALRGTASTLQTIGLARLRHRGIHRKRDHEVSDIVGPPGRCTRPKRLQQSHVCSRCRTCGRCWRTGRRWRERLSRQYWCGRRRWSGRQHRRDRRDRRYREHRTDRRERRLDRDYQPAPAPAPGAAAMTAGRGERHLAVPVAS